MNKRIKKKQCKYCGQYKRFSYILECDEHYCVYCGCRISIKRAKQIYKEFVQVLLKEYFYTPAGVCVSDEDNATIENLIKYKD